MHRVASEAVAIMQCAIDLLNLGPDNLSPLHSIDILLGVEVLHAKLAQSIAFLGLVHIVVLIH